MSSTLKCRSSHGAREFSILDGRTRYGSKRISGPTTYRGSHHGSNGVIGDLSSFPDLQDAAFGLLSNGPAICSAHSLGVRVLHASNQSCR